MPRLRGEWRNRRGYFGLEVVNVREFPLPGVARMFEITLDSGDAVRLAVDVEGDASELGIIRRDRDSATTVRLTAGEASTISALLVGIRMVHHPPGREPGGSTFTRDVRIPDSSPVLGTPLAALDLPDPDDTRVVAVVSDDTPHLVETDPGRRIQVGDRLVLVGRQDALARLVAHLIG